VGLHEIREGEAPAEPHGGTDPGSPGPSAEGFGPQAGGSPSQNPLSVMRFLSHYTN